MKIASKAPAYCSACFNQKPEQVHIDFDAAWDGPVVDGAIKVAIDDLVLCSDCVGNAAKLIGFVDDEKVHVAIDEAVERAKTAEAQNAGQAEYIKRLEGALASKVTPAPKKVAA